MTTPRTQIPCDGVFATAVLGPTRLLASFYWARYMNHGKPLVLCDYSVSPLDGDSWRGVASRLRLLVAERRSRVSLPLGTWLETEMLAQQVRESGGLNTQSIPSWLTGADSWQALCQSAASLMAGGDVGYTRQASDRMDVRPFLNEAGIYAGPRTEDPTAPAFLYGVVLGLDEVAARDPKPKPVARAPR